MNWPRRASISLGILTSMLLASCSEKINKVSAAPNGQVVVYEARTSGAGPAPDSVKVYLLNAGAAMEGRDQPVFEGQDVGAICYTWPTDEELNISISGGYVDRIVQGWRSSEGRLVKVRYIAEPRCKWRNTAGNPEIR